MFCTWGKARRVSISKPALAMNKRATGACQSYGFGVLKIVFAPIGSLYWQAAPPEHMLLDMHTGHMAP